MNMCLLAGCDSNNDESFSAVGTVVGEYQNIGAFSTIVQVDKKYALGETLELFEQIGCYTFMNEGV